MNVTHIATLANSGGGPLFEARLAGVAVDPDDFLYVLGDDRVRRFAPDRTSRHEFQLDGMGWSMLAEKDSLWIGMKGELRSYTPRGELLRTIRDGDRLGRITAIAAADGCLVAADSTHRAVHRYSRDGEYLGDLGAAANTRGFMIPNGALDLAGDPRGGAVLVAHPQKHRVERYDARGSLVATWGRFGMHAPGDFGGCCNPTNIAVARDGTIAVSEKAPPRVKLYDAEGRFELLVGQDLFDANSKNIDLAFDSRDRLYATDPARRVVEVFQLARGAAKEPTP